jgi:hypothetical protein
MNFIKRPILFLAIVLLGLPIAGRAQYIFQVDPFFSYFRDLDRYEIGYHYQLQSYGKFSGMVPFGGLGQGQGDTFVTKKFAFINSGFYVGTSIPFKATGHISLWAMSIGLNLNLLSWPGMNLAYDGTDITATAPLVTANTMQVGLPIGLEWKVGCDAINTRRLGFGASFGAGFIPQVSITSLTNVTADEKPFYAFNCAPYLKAEIAENLLFCMKFRAMASLGNVTLIDVNHYIPGVTDGSFNLTSTANIYLSVIIMPFSIRWKETAWWNTHDTYNQHDKLN